MPLRSSRDFTDGAKLGIMYYRPFAWVLCGHGYLELDPFPAGIRKDYHKRIIWASLSNDIGPYHLPTPGKTGGASPSVPILVPFILETPSRRLRYIHLTHTSQTAPSLGSYYTAFTNVPYSLHASYLPAVPG
jgi:hypothetical protein